MRCMRRVREVSAAPTAAGRGNVGRVRDVRAVGHVRDVVGRYGRSVRRNSDIWLGDGLRLRHRPRHGLSRHRDRARTRVGDDALDSLRAHTSDCVLTATRCEHGRYRRANRN